MLLSRISALDSVCSNHFFLSLLVLDTIGTITDTWSVFDTILGSVTYIFMNIRTRWEEKLNYSSISFLSVLLPFLLFFSSSSSLYFSSSSPSSRVTWISVLFAILFFNWKEKKGEKGEKKGKRKRKDKREWKEKNVEISTTKNEAKSESLESECVLVTKMSRKKFCFSLFLPNFFSFLVF